MSRFALGVDIGGTFTDVLLCDYIEERLYELKVPTTKGHTNRGLLEAIQRVAKLADTTADRFDSITLGTTTGTNAVLEKKGGPVALITTKGFRHVIAIGRHDVPKDVNMYTWEKPDKLVPPRNIFEVSERLDADGNVITPLDLDDVDAALATIHGRGISTIAVCLLHAYANPAHEQAIQKAAASAYPEMLVTCSSEVAPVFREYERSMATIINAYLLPLFCDYEKELRTGLGQADVAAPVWVMQSNGGLFSLDSAAKRPVTTILSGPVAGVKGAQFIGSLAHLSRLLTLDVGGTSADIALLNGDALSVRRDTEIGGLPLCLPMLDMKTIGAGGGSIARISLTGNLTVGPESAGSEPGPVCYGRGGEEPTVTDAHAVLGHLGTDLLDGAMPLNVEAARRAVREKVAEQLGLAVENAALGILDIVNGNMASALREVTVERGHNPTDYTLIAFGGAGPLHASALCHLLNIERFIVPANSGVLSALGMLTTDLRSDFSRTSILRISLPKPDLLVEAFSDLEAQAMRWLADERADPAESSLHRQADMRYRHQGYEVTIAIPDGNFTEASVREARSTFDVEHHQLYGYSMPDSPVEWITLRVTAVSRRAGLSSELLRKQFGVDVVANSRHLAPGSGWPVGGPVAPRQREAFDGDAKAFQTISVWDSQAIGRGKRISGPAIIELHTSTVLVAAGDLASADDYGNILVEVAG